MNSPGKQPEKNRGGRPKGVPNRANSEIRALAQKYGPDAIETLAYIMKHSNSEIAKSKAAELLLERGYGKAPQSIELENSGEIVVKVVFE